jgi:uncharacterized protein (TIGR03067 family)
MKGWPVHVYMKRTIDSVKLGFVVMLVAAAGCATQHKSDSPTPVSATPDSVTLQGTWKGQEVANPERSVSLVLSGTNLIFHGADSNDWCKGTFSLRPDTNPKQFIGVITDAPDPQYIGKTANAIYRIEEGVLTITGHQPGDPDPPTAFDASDARQLVLKAETN